MKHESSVDILDRVGLEFEAGDDAKVAAAALQGLEEVGVLVAIRFDDVAVGENDLVVDDTLSHAKPRWPVMKPMPQPRVSPATTRPLATVRLRFSASTAGPAHSEPAPTAAIWNNMLTWCQHFLGNRVCLAVLLHEEVWMVVSFILPRSMVTPWLMLLFSQCP
jgi:hypothetical protein